MMDITAEQMIEVGRIPARDTIGRLLVFRDYDTAMVGAWRLDLDGIGRLQVALDRAVAGIRDYQDRKAQEERL